MISSIRSTPSASRNEDISGIGTYDAVPGELLPVDDDLGMEDLLFDAFVEVVRHGTHEHALREVGDLRGGNQAVELHIGRGGEVVVAQRVGGSQLHDPAEALAQRLGRISQNLTCEDVAHGILDDLGFLLAVVAFELREVLKAQAYGHLVRTGRGDQVVQPSEIKNIGNPQFKIRY